MKKGGTMKIDDLYALIKDIEEEKKYIFIVYDKDHKIGIDVLDWEDEEPVEGTWLVTVEEAIEFVKEFKTSL